MVLEVKLLPLEAIEDPVTLAEDLALGIGLAVPLGS